MMRKRWLVAGLAVILSGALAACLPAAPEATTAPSPTPEPPATDAPSATSAPTETGETGEDAATEPPAPTAESTAIPNAEPTEHPDRPEEPAGVNAGFRSDPPTLIASTGRPQLIEAFTYW